MILLSICTLGFFLRIFNLESPSLWCDEIYTAGRIDHAFSLLEMVKNNLFAVPFPPFYDILMYLWTKLFKVSVFSLRFPSVIFSTLTIIAVFKLAQKMYDTKTGLVAALLLGVSTYSINYAQDAKMYALLWFLGTVSFYFFYCFIKNNRTRTLLWYVLFATLSAYVLYVGILFILIQNIIFLVSRNKSGYKKWFSGQALMLLLCLPWVPVFFDNLMHKTGFDWIPKISANYAEFIAQLFLVITGSAIGNTVFWDAVLFLLLGVYAFMSIRDTQERKIVFKFSGSDIFILLWIAVPIAMYLLIDFFFSPILLIRYMGFIHIPLIILFSRGLSKLGIKIRMSLILLILYSTFTNHLLPYYRDNLKINGEHWKKIFAQIYVEKEPNDSVFLDTSGIGFAQFFIRGVKNSFAEKQIQLLNEATLSRALEKKPNSVFIIYRNFKPQLEVLQGYALEQDFLVKNPKFIESLWNKDAHGFVGFLHFRKIGS